MRLSWTRSAGVLVVTTRCHQPHRATNTTPNAPNRPMCRGRRTPGYADGMQAWSRSHSAAASSRPYCSPYPCCGSSTSLYPSGSSASLLTAPSSHASCATSGDDQIDCERGGLTWSWATRACGFARGPSGSDRAVTRSERGPRGVTRAASRRPPSCAATQGHDRSSPGRWPVPTGAENGAGDMADGFAYEAFGRPAMATLRQHKLRLQHVTYDMTCENA